MNGYVQVKGGDTRHKKTVLVMKKQLDTENFNKDASHLCATTTLGAFLPTPLIWGRRLLR